MWYNRNNGKCIVNDDLEEGEIVEGVVEDWKLDEEVANIAKIEVKKGEAIAYTCENLLNNIMKLLEREFILMNLLNSNSESIPEETMYSFKMKWLEDPAPELRQKKQYVTHGEYSSQIISLDFNEKHNLLMTKKQMEFSTSNAELSI
ncbi:hypothetical protein Hanom_Chr01g00044281 [Helianthus anomalus]